MTDVTPGPEPGLATISLPHRNRAMDAFLVYPEGKGPYPGMVIIHEISGINDNIREITHRFAAQGYASLAVDLFSTANRVICMLRIFHGMLIRPINNGVVGDLRAAIGHLKTQPSIDAERIGVAGFCMGGTYALQLACVGEELRAAAVFYGMNPRPLETVAQACPIIGSYPERDFTAKAARELTPKLEEYNIPHDIKIYPEAGHSFFNDTGSAHHPQAASDSWNRMLAFFDRHIKA